MKIDVAERLSQLQQNVDSLRLYALVDGAQYEIHRGAKLIQQASMYALFSGTPDAPLAHAGPWLVDADMAGEILTADLAALEQTAHAVTWLIASQDLDGLAQLLQLNLNTRLPDGRTALLRFWDPRVLGSLGQMLTPEQSEIFFRHIVEWHLLHDGKRVWIGRQDAYPQ